MDGWVLPNVLSPWCVVDKLTREENVEIRDQTTSARAIK